MMEERRKRDRRGEPVAPTGGDIERQIDPTRRRPTREPEDREEDPDRDGGGGFFTEGFLGDDGP